MKELLTYIVQNLVDNPDQVSVTERKADGEIVYEVRVADGDMGKVIGRGRGGSSSRSASSCGPSPRERAKKYQLRLWTDLPFPPAHVGGNIFLILQRRNKYDIISEISFCYSILASSKEHLNNSLN